MQILVVLLALWLKMFYKRSKVLQKSKKLKLYWSDFNWQAVKCYQNKCSKTGLSDDKQWAIILMEIYFPKSKLTVINYQSWQKLWKWKIHGKLEFRNGTDVLSYICCMQIIILSCFHSNSNTFVLIVGHYTHRYF